MLALSNLLQYLSIRFAYLVGLAWANCLLGLTWF